MAYIYSNSECITQWIEYDNVHKLFNQNGLVLLIQTNKHKQIYTQSTIENTDLNPS